MNLPFLIEEVYYHIYKHKYVYKAELFVSQKLSESNSLLCQIHNGMFI